MCKKRREGKAMNNEKKKMAVNKMLIMLAINTITIFIVLSFSLSFAWFMMARNTRAGNASISVDNDTDFELAVDIADMPDPDTQEGIISFLGSDGFLRAEVTTGNKPSIIGKIIDESPKSSAEVELAPGSFGKLLFYVIPKVEGDATFVFNLSFRGGSSDDPMQHVADETVSLLNGHFLFFENRTTSTSPYYHYSDYLVDDTFTFSTAGKTPEKTVAGQDYYKVEVYWIWPATFSQMVFDNTNPRVRGQTVFGDINGADSTDRTNLINHIIENPEYFFRPHGETIPDYAAMMSDINTNFEALSDGYNNADQEIGDNTQWIIVEIDGSNVDSAVTP